MSLTLLENKITGSVEKLSESVVRIRSMKMTRSFAFDTVPVEGVGSGVIIDAKGYIVTNNHVIDGANKVEVVLKDGRSFVGKTIGRDPVTDIAVIKINAENLPSANLGDSEKLKVGQLVLAIGNALGLPGGATVSAGVISALGRPLPGSDFIFEGLVQTDAAINPGNSGGPLADINGNIIGINTAMIAYAQGLGFAIPINTVNWVIQQIFENGRVVRPWIGIYGITVNSSVARSFGLPINYGVAIARISSRSPAHRAGLQAGDIVIKAGKTEIREMKDLLSCISKVRIGEEITLHFIRDGERNRTSLVLYENPAFH